MNAHSKFSAAPSQSVPVGSWTGAGEHRRTPGGEGPAAHHSGGGRAPRRYFLPDEIDQVQRLYAEGMTGTEIAALLGRKSQSVFDLFKRLGLRRRERGEKHSLQINVPLANCAEGARQWRQRKAWPENLRFENVAAKDGGDLARVHRPLIYSPIRSTLG